MICPLHPERACRWSFFTNKLVSVLLECVGAIKRVAVNSEPTVFVLSREDHDTIFVVVIVSVQVMRIDPQEVRHWLLILHDIPVGWSPLLSVTKWLLLASLLVIIFIQSLLTQSIPVVLLIKILNQLRISFVCQFVLVASDSTILLFYFHSYVWQSWGALDVPSSARFRFQAWGWRSQRTKLGFRIRICYFHIGKIFWSVFIRLLNQLLQPLALQSMCLHNFLKIMLRLNLWWPIRLRHNIQTGFVIHMLWMHEPLRRWAQRVLFSLRGLVLFIVLFAWDTLDGFKMLALGI